MLDTLFTFTLQYRKNLYAILENTPKEQLLKIPTGFNNNIFWNIAHTIATQQLLCYKLSGLPMTLPTAFVDKFKKGTKPDGLATDKEIEQVKSFLVSSIEKTQKDFEAGIFKTYNEYTTSAKVTLRCFEDAFSFNFFHEGLHYGVILSLQKLVA